MDYGTSFSGMKYIFVCTVYFEYSDIYLVVTFRSKEL
jgi:hypothetical protein